MINLKGIYAIVAIMLFCIAMIFGGKNDGDKR